MNDLKSVLQLLLSAEPITDLMEMKDIQSLNPESGVKLLLRSSEVYFPKEKKRSKILPDFWLCCLQSCRFLVVLLLLLQ